MAQKRNTRGRKAAPAQSRRQPYVWKSEALHSIGDMLMIASVVALAAAIILYAFVNKPQLGVILFSLAFVLYGLPEYLKAYDNHIHKGEKAVTVGCLALAILFTVAGLLFFFLLGLNPNIK